MVNAVNGLCVEAKEEVNQPEYLRVVIENQKSDLKQVQPIKEFLNKLSQFKPDKYDSKVDTLQELVSSMRSNQALQASALVGRQVLVNNERFILGTQGDVSVALDLPVGVSQLIASIYCKAGKLIKNLNLGEPSPGFFQFNWDGTDKDNQRVSPGQYKVRVQGIVQGQNLSLRTMSFANIDSVSLGKNGKEFKLSISGIGSVSSSLLEF